MTIKQEFKKKILELINGDTPYVEVPEWNCDWAKKGFQNEFGFKQIVHQNITVDYDWDGIADWWINKYKNLQKHYYLEKERHELFKSLMSKELEGITYFSWSGKTSQKVANIMQLFKDDNY